MFFYPFDFTFVCPTEILTFSEKAPEFEAKGVQVRHREGAIERRRVQGAGCRVQGAGCRVQGAGCRVQGAVAL